MFVRLHLLPCFVEEANHFGSRISLNQGIRPSSSAVLDKITRFQGVPGADVIDVDLFLDGFAVPKNLSVIDLHRLAGNSKVLCKELPNSSAASLCCVLDFGRAVLALG